MTIQVIASEQCLLVIFLFVNEVQVGTNLSICGGPVMLLFKNHLSVTINSRKKIVDQWFVMLFSMIQNVVQSFNSVHQILHCCHLNESYKYLISFHSFVNRYFLTKIFRQARSLSFSIHRMILPLLPL